MKSSRGIVWGGLLVILGTIWLLRNMNVLVVDWDNVLPYWPVLLILAGVVLLVAGATKSSRLVGLVPLFVALAVLAGIVNKSRNEFSNRDNWNFGWNDHDDDEDEDFHSYNDEEHEEDRDEDYKKEQWKKENGRPRIGNYKTDMEDFIQKAKFNLEGGAGSFKLEGNTTRLFEANTKTNMVGFVSNTTFNRLDKSATVNLKMEEGNVKIKNGEISNQATIRLNEKPVWTVDLGIGAGKGNFDFSKYKVEKLKISTGVADMDIKLGDQLASTEVDIEAGVASITLDIPRTVGCELRIDGALNAKTFDGLEKVGANLYRSPDFNSASKKVVIDFEGGLTSININRY